MKRWKCTVCGYIHTGEEPPESCPVCGADKSLFVEINEDGAEVPAQTKPKPAAAPSEQWKCAVCGYKHKGETPPDDCPVCGSDNSRFFPAGQERPVRIDDIRAEPHRKEAFKETDPAAEIPPRKENPWLHRLQAIEYPPWLDRLTKEMTRWHAHPITVHLPNGVLPVSVFFMVLALMFQSPALSKAAFFNLIVVLLAMPLVMFSGYNDWQRRFGGHMTKVFHIKIICGAVVLLGTFILSVWWVLQPEILISGAGGRWLFGLLSLITLGAAITAGYMGGKLVFLNGDSGK